jgi:phage gp16-like protein
MSLTPAVRSKIHIARQQLGLDDEAYRAVLARITGQRSSKDLNATQAGRLLQEFERLGWKPKPGGKAKGKPHNFKTLPGEIEVIQAQLTNMGLPWSYADAIAKQMFRVQRVSWLRKPEQLQAILAALHVEQEKRGLLATVEELCKALGIDAPNRLAGLEQLPEGWERQRPILRSLVETLHAVAIDRGVL